MPTEASFNVVGENVCVQFNCPAICQVGFRAENCGMAEAAHAVIEAYNAANGQPNADV